MFIFILQYLQNQRCTSQYDGLDFALIEEKLADAGISLEQRIDIYKIIAAILHLGNIFFEENVDTGNSQISESSKFHLKHAANLLTLKEDTLESLLLARTMEVSGSDTITLVKFLEIFRNV